MTIRSLLNSKAAKGIIGAIIIASFAYIGIVLFAWTVLGLFHPNVRNSNICKRMISNTYMPTIHNSLAHSDLVQRAFILYCLGMKLSLSLILFFLKMYSILFL